MAIALHRPNMLRYSNWTANCIHELESTTTEADHELAYWAKLHHLVEESSTALGLEDHNNQVNIGDLRIQSTLRALDKQLMQWKLKSNWDHLNGMYYSYLKSLNNKLISE
jgi:hypothetical protein